ncbi:MAG: hypothetical protein ABI601_15555 [bacterium]
MLKRLCALIIAGATLAACSESSQPTGVIPVPLAANEYVLAQLTCRVDAVASTMSCAPATADRVAGRSSDLILGGQNVYVKLTSTNVVTTPTVTTTADVTVKNLTGQPWNTGDGTTVDTAGVKVFFMQQPTNGVAIANPTGTSMFTASGQPYFKYSGVPLLGADQLLTAGETSGTINWQFTLNGASSFTFGVLIVAKMPDETGTLLWKRDTLTRTQSVEFMQTVWGFSATDVWVGGPSGGPTTLQHWNGSSWTPAGGYCTLTPLKCETTSLWGAASNDVWAVGSEFVHYDGSAWTFFATPAATLRAVWGVASNDIYAGGNNGDIYHYDGATWTALSHVTTGLGTQLVSTIWGTGTSNIYVGTSDPATTGGLGVRRFNGSTWSTVSAGINSARVIWGSGPNDIYAGGDAGLLRHWNGTSWSTASAPFGSSPADAIFGIWGSSSTSVYVTQTNGNLWHWNGSSWVNLPNANMGFYGIWGSGRDVFAVGFEPGAGGVYDNIVVRGTR